MTGAPIDLDNLREGWDFEAKLAAGLKVPFQFSSLPTCCARVRRPFTWPSRRRWSTR